MNGPAVFLSHTHHEPLCAPSSGRASFPLLVAPEKSQVGWVESEHGPPIACAPCRQGEAREEREKQGGQRVAGASDSTSSLGSSVRVGVDCMGRLVDYPRTGRPLPARLGCFRDPACALYGFSGSLVLPSHSILDHVGHLWIFSCLL